MIDAGLSAAGFNINQSQVEYHRILESDVPAEITPRRDIDMIMVPVPFPITSDTRYLCVEIDAQSGGVTTITNPRVTKRHGQVLRFEYTVGGGNRKGFIWLKQ